ncbi:hypothetical protein [Tenacibaculum finnmarkense]|uniref:hypothetical protein n=1 Tax=Tenacibaculum finnmarkense TaxID=2781243 RepID=UPI001E478710|nr:hypothetical protein [Tenacibaculum finnmarkense]MCD8413071.1 hypothetical protein [Tenacibaculum finnmarkense genomovar ulcerans]MCG8206319.1 hypothetical protein [Tenacibaculum finnmarkense genomovar finnmarkense]MCG8722363.1 hypothetical protein [Tenacibaculum finnmarkense]MCG8740724.1 hypothetical protein [Tenacibaculum finnmarkense]MCG8764032.1 hypothetical protein [Tenacibaculum finnmarkense]
MLQKLSIYFFILLYLVAMLRPVAPFVEYAINYDYISKVLCINKDKPELACNGKCQLMLKIEQQQQDDFESLQIVLKDYPIGFIELVNLPKNTLTAYHKKALFTYNQTYSYLFENAIFHPPNTSFLYRLA